jgi:hypothetical protein
MPTKTVEDPLAKAWSKISPSTDPLIRAAYIPIYDGKNWRLLRNTWTIFEGAENCADPVKVEQLRRTVVDLYRAYPETLDALAKLGIRVRTLVNHQIRNQADVTAWATSLFNMAPQGHPEHVAATQALCYEDFHVVVPTSGKAMAYVVPAGPRGSGISATKAFDVPGMKQQYGPRHDYSKAAFADQNGKPATRSSKAPESLPEAHEAPLRRRMRSTAPQPTAKSHRGRPRADGLAPGSTEAKAADAAKRKAARERNKALEAKRQRAGVLPPTPPPPRRKLIRRRAPLQSVA